MRSVVLRYIFITSFKILCSEPDWGRTFVSLQNNLI